MKRVFLSRHRVHSGDLILVNRDHPYRENARVEQVSPYRVMLQRRFAAIFLKLMEETRAFYDITAVSGWRSQAEQEQIYSESLLENGPVFTASYVALPGHSEHQTGLAVDLALNQPDIDMLRPFFPYDGVCGAFRRKALKFGLIERYPQNKENVTGIAHEPWHFRYVGAPHAMIMQQNGFTLEEYHEHIKRYTQADPLVCDNNGSPVEIFCVSAESGAFEIEDGAVFTVSGDNMDGFIVTVWR